MELIVYNMQAEKVGDSIVDEDLLTGEVNQPLLREAILAHLANARQGTASTKTRGQVRGGGKKPFPQKGTGRARAGSIRSPLWVGGGTTFGPKPRDYRQRFPRRKKRRALASALQLRAQEDRLILVDAIAIEQGRTREMAHFLRSFADTLGVTGKVLVIVDGKNESVQRASGNIPYLDVISADNVGTVHILYHDAVLVEQKAMETITGRLRNA